MDNFNSDQQLQERTLTVIHYVVEGKKRLRKRITISPQNIAFLVAGEEAYDTVEGRELRQVNVVLSNNDSLSLLISALDLSALERCVGAYFLG